MSEAALLRDAIAASGLSARGFAVGVLAVDERTVRRWLAGERRVPGPVLQICRVVIDDPWMVRTFAVRRLTTRPPDATLTR